jgi:hypothetical protein
MREAKTGPTYGIDHHALGRMVPQSLRHHPDRLLRRQHACHAIDTMSAARPTSRPSGPVGPRRPSHSTQTAAAAAAFRARTSLDDIDPDIPEAGIDLLAHKRRRDGVHAVDAQRVLCRQRRRRRHGEAAMCRDDLLVRLEAPAAPLSACVRRKVEKNGPAPLWEHCRTCHRGDREETVGRGGEEDGARVRMLVWMWMWKPTLRPSCPSRQ